MRIQSCLLCVGPYHPAIVTALQLVDEAYSEMPEGHPVYATLFHADYSDDHSAEEIMESIAEACKVDDNDANTFKVDPKNINWEDMHEINTEEASLLHELIKYGFVVFYCPVIPDETPNSEEVGEDVVHEAP